MHPAWSVIFFTCTSGVGFGLIFWLALGLVAWPSPNSFAVAALTALGLSVVGLLSSTLHLGHPERAWRALSQWRSSWLSREGVLALLCLGLFSVFAGYAWYYQQQLMLLGWLCALLAAAVVYATAMIYASLKTVARWHDGLTPICYLAFSAASGLVALHTVSVYADVGSSALARSAALLLALAWGAKLIWWWRAARKRPTSDVASATGLGALGDVKLLFAPHSSENYLQQEMGFSVARQRALALRRLALTLGALLPVSLLLFSPSASVAASSLALLCLFLGLLVERWLFFAEAKHTVMLYYGG